MSCPLRQGRLGTDVKKFLQILLGWILLPSIPCHALRRNHGSKMSALLQRSLQKETCQEPGIVNVACSGMINHLYLKGRHFFAPVDFFPRILATVVISPFNSYLPPTHTLPRQGGGRYFIQPFILEGKLLKNKKGLPHRFTNRTY